MADPIADNQDVEQVTVEILAANSLRNGAILFNEGAIDVWLGFGEDAVLNKGIKVPAGGSFVAHYGGEPSAAYNLFILAINGISLSGTNTVTFQEI